MQLGCIHLARLGAVGWVACLGPVLVTKFIGPGDRCLHAVEQRGAVYFVAVWPACCINFSYLVHMARRLAGQRRLDRSMLRVRP